MNSNQLYYYIVELFIFLAGTLLVSGLAKIFSEYYINARIKSVTKRKKAPKKVNSKSSLAVNKIKEVFAKMNDLSQPDEGWQESRMKLRFIRAGFRKDTFYALFYSVKTFSFFLLPLLFLISVFVFQKDLTSSKITLIMLALASVGYYCPDFYIARVTSKRAKEMGNSLPDFIDLLVMCTSSGLGLDAALNRVSMEMARNSPVLAHEFYITCLEIRAGSGRVQALKNLALRVNLEDLNSLVTMLVQADKFGTSLVDSMKIQAEFMRGKRFQRAEEVAAKIPVMMLLPLIAFIFPILMFVLVGPAIIQMSTAFSQ